jgi:dienelactone hydrolase
MAMKAGWIPLLAALSVAACQGHEPSGGPRPLVSRLEIPPDTAEPVRTWLEEFRAFDAPFEFKTRSIRGGRETEQLEITFPSAVRSGHPEADTVTLLLWRPERPAPTPALIVVHYLGGSIKPLEEACATFARKGVAAALLYLPFYGPRRPAGAERAQILAAASPETLVTFLRQSVSDIRRARDALSRLPSIDPGRVGIFGISLGAIVGSLAAGVDGRFAGGIFVVGGGDLASIVFHGSAEAKPFRDGFERAGLDEAAARKALQPVDPLTYAFRLDGKRTRLYNCRGDEVIPSRCAESLAGSIPRAEITWLPGGHKWIALYTPSILAEAAEFIRGASPHPAR